MNGTDRRRLELSHPELFPTAEERKQRKEIVKEIVSVVNGIVMTFMIFGVVVVAYLSTRYMGWEGFLIAFFGILIVVTIGMLMAYNLGNRIQPLYTTYIRGDKTW